MITDVEDYFAQGCGRCERFATPDCSTRKWLEGLNQLRRIARDVGLVETAKWGHPCYMHAGRNIALMGAFRESFRLTFMNSALMKDPLGLLQRQGPNTRQPDMILFQDNGRVAELEPAIRDYLLEAMSYAEAGVKPPAEAIELDLPEELVEALDADPELAEAFHALTRGRRNSYVVELSSAKTAATRLKRIEKFRPSILAGRGAKER
jgi:uncharacterized protein YdeI (YjbR/CyaY-like superfamily)